MGALSGPPKICHNTRFNDAFNAVAWLTLFFLLFFIIARLFNIISQRVLEAFFVIVFAIVGGVIYKWLLAASYKARLA